MGYGGIKTVARVMIVMLLNPIAHLNPKTLPGCLDFNPSNFLARTAAVENFGSAGQIMGGCKD